MSRPGEHLSDAYYGFMNGAAETGRLAAQVVLNKIEEQWPVSSTPLENAVARELTPTGRGCCFRCFRNTGDAPSIEPALGLACRTSSFASCAAALRWRSWPYPAVWILPEPSSAQRSERDQEAL
jgi:hypothetical protein